MARNNQWQISIGGNRAERTHCISRDSIKPMYGTLMLLSAIHTLHQQRTSERYQSDLIVLTPFFSQSCVLSWILLIAQTYPTQRPLWLFLLNPLPVSQFQMPHPRQLQTPRLYTFTCRKPTPTHSSTPILLMALVNGNHPHNHFRSPAIPP